LRRLSGIDVTLDLARWSPHAHITFSGETTDKEDILDIINWWLSWPVWLQDVSVI